MKVTVRCFASVRELLGAEVVDVDVPAGATVGELKARLAETAPGLARLPLACAVNREWAGTERELAEGDEIAFIPPISGGGGGEPAPSRLDLTGAPLDPRPLEREVRTDEDGAVVTFAGVTRSVNDGFRVAHLSYEVYPEMAEEVMGRVFEDALGRFEITRVRAAHRLGPVAIGEVSVVVTVSAPHRAAAFDACRYVMDRLKAEVPIFKRETLTDGESRWVGDPPQDGPRV